MVLGYYNFCLNSDVEQAPNVRAIQIIAKPLQGMEFVITDVGLRLKRCVQLKIDDTVYGRLKQNRQTIE